MSNHSCEYQLFHWLTEILYRKNVQIELGCHNKGNQVLLAFPDTKSAKVLLPVNAGLAGFYKSLDLYPVLSLKHVVKKHWMVLLRCFYFLLTKNYFITVIGNEISANLYRYLSTNASGSMSIANYAVRIGSKGAGQKLIFQFQDDQNQVVSYIKIGDSRTRGRYLKKEQRVLNYLRNECNDLIEVPRVVGLKEIDDLVSLEITPLTEYAYYPQKPLEKVAYTLGLLAERTRQIPDGAQIVDETLLHQFIANEQTRSFLSKHLNRVHDELNYRCLAHRDLPAWNVLSNKHTRLAIIDWEFAQETHYPFQDLFHYILHTFINNKKGGIIKAYQNLFVKSDLIKHAISKYGEIVGITETDLIHSLFVCYLWDWFCLEASTSTDVVKGTEYRELLNWLTVNENCDKYVV